MGRHWLRTLGVVVVLIAVFFIIRMAATAKDNGSSPAEEVKAASYEIAPPRPKTQAELKEELRQTEIKNPMAYLLLTSPGERT